MNLNMDNILDTEEIEKNISKFKMIKNQEDLNFEAIKDELLNINYYYDTNNTSHLDDLYFEVIQKLSVISKIHHLNIMVLDKNLEKYRTTRLIVENSFAKLDDNK